MEYKINRRIAKKLSEEFGWSHADIGKLYNSTRSAVNRLFTGVFGKVNYEIQIDEVSEKEFELIYKMIKSKLYHLEVEGVKIKLFNDGKGKYGFVVSDGEKNKVIFNEDFENDEKWQKISCIVKDNRLNEFSEAEVELIKNSTVVSIMKKRCFRPYNYPLFHKLKTKRKMNEEEFVKFLGYEKFALKKIENTDEKILEFFEESLIEGKVYIPWSEQWIREYSCRQKMSIEEFVKFFGYDQYSNRDKKIKSGKNNSDFIDAILKKLELEQKGKDKIINSKLDKKIIVERDRKIIKYLKELYSCKCQICQNKGFADIIQEDGNGYCEAHHIEELANAKLSLEAENEVLDHYRNIIILCPYHHRYLHFNRGGKYRLEKCEDGLFLVNEVDRVRVEVDYHLNEGV